MKIYLPSSPLKNISVFISFIALFASVGEAETYLIKDKGGNPLKWSDTAIWSTGSYSDPTAAVYIPGYYDEPLGIDTRDAKIIFPGGGTDKNLVLEVDDNYTLTAFGSEFGQWGVTLDMTGMLEEGTKDSSITLIASDSTATYDFIKVSGGMTIEEDRENTYTAFKGGTVKLTGLDEGVEGRISVSCATSAAEPIMRSSVTFSDTTTLIAECDLRLVGDTSSSIALQNLNATVNLNGTTIIGANTGTDEEPVWNYKTLTIGTGSNPVQGTSLVANITGTLIANNLIQNEKTITNLSGTMDLVMPLTGTWNNSATDNESALRILGNFVMQDGGVLNITGSSSSYSNGAIYVGGGGSFVMESGSKATLENAALRSTAYGSSKAATIDIQNGAELTAAYLWIGGNTQMTISGKLTTTQSNIYTYGNQTLTTIKNGADIIASSITLAYSTMVVEEDVAAGSIKANYIGIDNNNARLKLYSSNAIVNIMSQKSEDVYFEALIGSCYLDIYADQTFDSLRFRSQDKRDDITSIDYYVYIDNAVNLISLNTLANNTLIKPADEDLLERYLILDNFRNELIHVDAIDSSIDLSLISSKDGYWTDFRFEVDPDGGYWLAATYIPEPSVYAAVLGLAALMFALRVRRR